MSIVRNGAWLQRANVPRALDPDDPLAGLPGNPQTTWKRRALETLVERATAALA